MDIDLLKKHESENDLQYLWRVDCLVNSGKYKNWEEIYQIVNKELFGDDDFEYKTESTFRKKCKYARDFYEKVFSKFLDDAYIKELQAQKRELQKERIKFKTEKIEYNRWLREEARDELIKDEIITAIMNLAPMELPKRVEKQVGSRSGILMFSDPHYGVEFELLGLKGEILNSYSPEIFEARMMDLLYQTIDIAKKEGFNSINIFSLGDDLDGILRVGQLFKLRYGVIEGAIKYADFIVRWLNEFTKNGIFVDFHITHGNHTELRMLGEPKGTFKDQNMGFIIVEFIKTRMQDNPNFKLHLNPTGLVFTDVSGYTFLGIHGEVKDMGKALKDFSQTYNVEIDYLVAGHKHHAKSESVGIRKGVINVPSVIGIDDYSLSLAKTSDAGATFVVMEEGKGKTIEYSIILN